MKEFTHAVIQFYLTTCKAPVCTHLRLPRPKIKFRARKGTKQAKQWDHCPCCPAPVLKRSPRWAHCVININRRFN